MPRMKRFRVHCADDDYYFKYERKLRESEVSNIFARRIQAWNTELFPGLLLEDEDGNLLRPELQVVLVPVEQ